MTDPISNNSVRGISANIDLGPTGSLQFQFAKLQLAMAELSKNGAMDYMNRIQDSQAEQKKVADMMQSVRQAQADVKSGKEAYLSEDVLAYMKTEGLAVPANFTDKATVTQAKEVLARCEKLRQDAVDGKGDCPWGKGASMMPEADAKFLRDHGIKYDTYGNDLAHNPTEWSYNIGQIKEYISGHSPKAEDYDTVLQSLQAKQDSLGTNTQQLMVFVQDYMGQYNSYLQGGNSVIQQANQTLAELARVR